MIVVFDANVLIPLILEASLSTRLFSRLVKNGHKVAVSPEILDEVRKKMLTKKSLRRWLELQDDEIDRFLRGLPTICLIVPGVLSTQGVVKADLKDDKIIAAAVESEASYIVSEDRHLRDLGEWEGIKILSRVQMMLELDRLEAP